MAPEAVRYQQAESKFRRADKERLSVLGLPPEMK
jgi:hypothetical protein